MDNLGGYGTARTVGELRDLLALLPDSMPAYFETAFDGQDSEKITSGDLGFVQVGRCGVMTVDANARGLDDDPLAEQFVLFSWATAGYN